MGFIHDIKRVLRLLPQQRQNLMFSATYSDDIRDLANRFVKNPVAIQVTPRNATADKVEQSAYRVPKEHKRHLLAHLIKEGDWHQVLVFTRTKHGANRLTQQLERAGITAMAIHGNKSQNARVRALEDFKENRITALVATEVAARGLDIKELPHVVNYELPNVPEDYVHRIGRTARAGSTGAAISLVSPDELSYLKDIEKLLKRSVEFAPTPKFEIKEGSHPTRAERDGEPREHQPHQDPRRRPEHRRPRTQRPHGRAGAGHGGQRRAPGTASHEAYADGARDQQPRRQDGQRHEQRRHEGRPNDERSGGHRGQGGHGQQQSQPHGQRRGGHGAHQGGRRGGNGGSGGRHSSKGGRGGFVRGARSGGGRGNGGSGGAPSGGFSRMN
jgi:ATP-dependent RNA helicase RhlE